MPTEQLRSAFKILSYRLHKSPFPTSIHFLGHLRVLAIPHAVEKVIPPQ